MEAVILIGIQGAGKSTFYPIKKGPPMKPSFFTSCIVMALAAPTPVAGDSGGAKDVLSTEVTVPAGVVYKKGLAATNRRALDKLSRAFLAADHKLGSDDLLSSTLICGPGLWRNIKDDAQMKKIKTGITKIKVPTNKGTQVLEGKLFQGKGEVATFWKTFLRKYKFDGQATIRRPTTGELKLYWAMIPYDITEPIFMVDGKDATILAQFAGEEAKIGWIDDYKDMRLKDQQ